MCSSNVYPHAIAAHPHKPTQFAVGLTDGEVYIFEPQEIGGKWGMLPLVDSGSTTSMPVESESWETPSLTKEAKIWLEFINTYI